MSEDRWAQFSPPCGTWKAMDAAKMAAFAVRRQEQEREEQRRKRLQEAGLRLGPPGWHYDPEERVWLYADGEWTGRLVWLAPSYGFGAEWRTSFRNVSGWMYGGGLSGRMKRVDAMREVLAMAREMYAAMKRGEP